MNFSKMHGLGNDFIIVNMLDENDFSDYESMAKKLCNRNFGIGADGLILVLPSEKADVRMRIFNSDGSEPEMCGNGIRCFAKFVYEAGIIKEKRMHVETLAGIIIPEILLNEKGDITGIKVDMGEPQLERSQIPMLGLPGKVIKENISIQGEDFQVTAVSMGNPHCVIFVPEIEKVDIKKWGPLLENHEVFPNKTNVEFAQIVSQEEIIMRVWERGAGITLACGTGACATLVAGVLNGLTNRQATLKLAGGDLFIEWAENNHVYMTGPAVEVFRGTVFLDNL